MFRELVLLCLVSITISGCASLHESTNTLTDERILSETSGALGYSPSDLEIESRRTEGTNTYVNLSSNDKKKFTCVITGGSLLMMGMSNPPRCGKKGDPINTSPFQ